MTDGGLGVAGMLSIAGGDVEIIPDIDTGGSLSLDRPIDRARFSGWLEKNDRILL